MRMKFYLKEKGFPIVGLKNHKIASIYADMRYSETVTNYKEWILGKVELGDFIGMKTGRKKRPAKQRINGVPPVKVSGYNTFLKSSYWRYVRKLVVERDGKKCTKCGDKKSLQAHHLTYANHYNEHKHLEDLVTLCSNCHKEEHKRLDIIKKDFANKYNLPVIEKC